MHQRGVGESGLEFQQPDSFTVYDYPGAGDFLIVRVQCFNSVDFSLNCLVIVCQVGGGGVHTDIDIGIVSCVGFKTGDEYYAPCSQGCAGINFVNSSRDLTLQGGH